MNSNINLFGVESITIENYQEMRGGRHHVLAIKTRGTDGSYSDVVLYSHEQLEIKMETDNDDA